MDTAEAIGAEMPKGKKKKKMGKKNISRIASSNPDELSQQMLTGREKTPKRERERERKDVGRVATPS